MAFSLVSWLHEDVPELTISKEVKKVAFQSGYWRITTLHNFLSEIFSFTTASFYWLESTNCGIYKTCVLMPQTKIITKSKNNLYCKVNRSTVLKILISRAVYPVMLKLFKLFLKLIEDWFLLQKLVDYSKLETCKIFRERLDKNNRSKKTELSKIVQKVGLWRKLWWICASTKLCHHK